jgi:hypothetical protein
MLLLTLVAFYLFAKEALELFTSLWESPNAFPCSFCIEMLTVAYLNFFPYNIEYRSNPFQEGCSLNFGRS